MLSHSLNYYVIHKFVSALWSTSALKILISEYNKRCIHCIYQEIKCKKETIHCFILFFILDPARKRVWRHKTNPWGNRSVGLQNGQCWIMTSLWGVLVTLRLIFARFWSYPKDSGLWHQTLLLVWATWSLHTFVMGNTTTGFCVHRIMQNKT